MIRRALVLAAILSVAAVPPVALAPGTAWACSCVKLSVREHVDRADVIFTGVVSGSEISGQGEITWQFHVQRIYKGAAGPRLYVTSQASGASCGYEFVASKPYLVFARQVDDDRLVTSLCSGNRSLGDEPVGAAFGAGREPQDRAGQSVPFDPSGDGSATGVTVVAGFGVVVSALLLGVALLTRRN